MTATPTFDHTLLELVTPARAAAWSLALLGRGQGRTFSRKIPPWQQAPATDEVLAPLSVPVRLMTRTALLALARAWQPQRDVYQAAVDELLRSFSDFSHSHILEQALGLLAREQKVLRGEWKDSPSSESSIAYFIEGLSAQWPHGDVREAALACALLGRLPLCFHSPEAVLAVAESALGLAIGRAAAFGDSNARYVMRELLAQAPEHKDQALCRGLLAGAGEGLAVEGLRWLIREVELQVCRGSDGWPEAFTDECPHEDSDSCPVAQHHLCPSAHSEGCPQALRHHWAEALREALMAYYRGAHFPGLLEAPELWRAFCCLASLACAEKACAALPTLRRRELLQYALTHYIDSPEVVRALVASALLRGEMEWPSEIPLGLGNERSPLVLQRVLEVLARPRQKFLPEVQRLFARLYATHPDPQLRQAIAKLLPLVPEGGEGAEVHSHGGEVHALPPRALARGPLDALEAALFEGECEDLVVLAQGLPEALKPQARKLLIAALEIPHVAQRREIITSLGHIGTLKDAPALLDAAKRYRTLEGTVAAALRQLNARESAEALAQLFHRRLKWADDEAVADYCAIAGPERVAHLMAALKMPFYPAARAGAARALGELRTHESVFALRHTALHDVSERVRSAAMEALQELMPNSLSDGEQQAFALLYEDPDELDQLSNQLQAMGQLALPGLRAALLRGDLPRREAACMALTGIAGHDASQLLTQALEDPEESVRWLACAGLKMRGEEPQDSLSKANWLLAANTPESFNELRRLMLNALMARNSEGEDKLALQDLPELLVTRLALGDVSFRKELLSLLDSFANLPALQAKAHHLAAARGDWHELSQHSEALALATAMLDHTWELHPHRARLTRLLGLVPLARLVEVRAEGQVALGWRFEKALMERAGLARPEERTLALELLKQGGLHHDVDVRAAAWEGMMRLGGLDGAKALLSSLQSPFEDVLKAVGDALGSLGQPVEEVVLQLSTEAMWESRYVAAHALGKWRYHQQRAADLLIQLACDPEYQVANCARGGLKRIGLAPSPQAVGLLVAKAQTNTVKGLEAWLNLHRPDAALPEVEAALETLLKLCPIERLPQRLGLIGAFRAQRFAPQLKRLAGDGAKPLGVRLAATEALRVLLLRACTVCHGEGRVQCPGCNGAGESVCERCHGELFVRRACDNSRCTAQLTVRSVQKPECPTCRGRGTIETACTCSQGRAPCSLCLSHGRIRCVACEGRGEIKA